MNQIILDWKSFGVDLEKIKFHFKATLSSNFDGLLCSPDNLIVIFKENYSDNDNNLVITYWDNATPSTFARTLQEIVAEKINQAITFGNGVIVDVTIENVTMGITQSGKTRIVSDYCRALKRYLTEGSLYAALEEIENLKTIGVPSEMSPFVTEDRLNICKTKILTFLSAP